MSFLTRSPGLSSLRLLSRSQLLPIHRLLVTTPRVNCATSPSVCKLLFSSPQIFKGPARQSPRIGQSRPLQQPLQQKPVAQNIDDFPDYTNSPKWYSWDNLIVGGIIGSCLLVFGYHGLLQGEVAGKKTQEAVNALITFRKNWTHSLEGIKEGRFDTLITSAFMHFSLPHLAFNMFTLWGFGRPFIWNFGVQSFLVVYFGSAIIGGLSQTALWEVRRSPFEQLGAGASGAVLGIISAFTLCNPGASINLMFIPIPIPLALASVLTVGVSVAGIVFPEKIFPGVGHADHLGGMAFGALWWFLQVRKGRIPRVRR